MTNPQTEARAIALKAARHVRNNADAEAVENIVTSMVATALAAKDAELADERAELKRDRDAAWRACQRAETQLAEARAFAREWHRQCETVATILNLPEPEGSGRHAEMVRSKFEDLSAQLAEANKALEPFADIAGEPWANESGWTDAACQNDRICDWFGPSAFLAARRAREAQGGE